MYLYAIDYDNYYGIVIADGDVDGNDVTESDDSYDYHTNTNDDDDDDADYDEILTVECSRPQWLSWMRRPTGDQDVAGSTPAEVGGGGREWQWCRVSYVTGASS